MAVGDRPTSPARGPILAFCSGVQLTAIRAVVLRFWLPLPLMMRTESARLGRGAGAARRRFEGRGRESPAAVDGRTALVQVHGGTRLVDGGPGGERSLPRSGGPWRARRLSWSKPLSKQRSGGRRVKHLPVGSPEGEARLVRSTERRSWSGGCNGGRSCPLAKMREPPGERSRGLPAHILRAVPRRSLLLDCALVSQRAGSGTKPERIDVTASYYHPPFPCNSIVAPDPLTKPQWAYHYDYPRACSTMTMRIATAEWANPDEVEERYLYRDGMIWLGRSSEHQVPLGYMDDRHVCLVGGSRGVKGTTGIIPALLTWPGSVGVVDPKGENATSTAARRGAGSQHATGMNQTVKVLDPFQSAQVDHALRGRFNPLDALDPKNEETIDEAGRIADALVVIHEGGVNDPFWDESARAMVKGLLLHILTAPRYEGRRNLNTLRKLVTRGDWESIDELRQAGETNLPPAHGLLWTGLANSPAFDGLVAGIGDSFTNMLLNSPKQYESVLQVANRNTEFIDSPAMQRVLGASDFQLSELKTRPEGLSLYLCLPQRYMRSEERRVGKE